MKRVLFDTNVALDVLLNRAPWVDDASTLWQAVQGGKIEGYLSASCVSDIFYIVRKLKDLATARRAIRLCLDTFEICSVGRVQLERAERIPGVDFEDNLQLACAEEDGLDAIVTRDPQGFTASTIPILRPEEAVQAIAR